MNVSLDDIVMRDLAKNDLETFFGDHPVNVFNTLKKSNKILGQGGIVCLKNDFLPLDKNNSIIPICCI